jgi:hypothetical protein
MNVDIKLNIAPAVAFLDDKERRQIPFALARATNDTGTDFQNAMRTGISRRFVLRQPQFILDSVKIQRGDWATSKGFKAGGGKFTTIVSMGAEGSGHKNSGILTKFEDGGDRVSDDPDRPIAIPTAALRGSFAELPPRSMYPKNLRLISRRGVDSVMPANVHRTKRGVEQIQGKHRTFVLNPATNIGANVWGVFQRYGPRRSDIQLIWRYRTRIHIPRRLQWWDTAQRIVPERFTENFRTRLAEALRTAF